MTRCCLGLCLAALLGLLAAGATAQTNKVSRPFSAMLGDWTRQLDQAQAYLDGLQQTPAQTDDWFQQLGRLQAEAREAQARARADLAKAEELLKALGPEPAEGQPPETDEVSRERAAHNDSVAQLRARVTQTDLAIARADQLRSQLGELNITGFLDTLLQPYPAPYDPATWRRGLADGLVQATAAVRAVLTWREDLAAQRRGNAIFVRLLLLAVLAVGVGWIVRRLLLHQFGRTDETEPSYTRRFGGALAEAAARGLVPAALLLMIWQRAGARDDLFFGRMADFVEAGCLGLIVLVLVVSLPRAVLAPDRPRWTLMPLDPAAARALSRWITIIGVVFAIDVGLIVAFQSVDVTPRLRSIYAAVTDVLEGVGVLWLMRPALWRLRPHEAGDGEDKMEAAAAAPFWPFVRTVVGVVTVVGIAATALGYAALGDYLIKNLVVTGLLVGAMFLLRGVLRELAGLALRTALVREAAGISYRGRRLLKFWLRALLDLVLLIGGLMLVLPFWGVAWQVLVDWTLGVLAGVKIGNVTLSIVDIVMAVLVLAVGIVLTRIVRRALADRLLPETNLDLGVQNSIAAGFGYVGILVAATMAIATLGIDLSNIALIAGALSVGIGFGLQNVVNNFVSGLILLIERPVKVGDWVVVGGNEGFVKKINVRSTELQTFQRASVIIPNADLISSNVTNWTHQDRYGRVEVAVGVAYGSDTGLVRDILLEVANAHDRVLGFPEPFVVFMNFGDSSLDFELRCYTDDVLYKLIIASDLRFEIDRRFREAGVEIPFPQRVVHMAPPPAADG